MQRVTLIEGDGIGPEVVEATKLVLDAAGADIEWEPVLVGNLAREAFGEVLPDSVLESIRKNGVGLKGPITTPIGEGISSINVRLRKELKLYACVRPVRSLPGIQCLHPDIDLTIIQESTEDLYAGIEHEIVPGVVESLKVITTEASTRIARFAFQHAKRVGYESVTAVHKANIMKLSDGLFLDCCRQVAKEFPDIRFNERIVDALSMKLVTHPQEFEILVTTNLYGDILSDLAAGLVGGLGLVPGANIGDGCAVFEAVHGSWPEAAGKGIANPTALIFSGVMLLSHLGYEEKANAVREAVVSVLAEGAHVTQDLGGRSSTREFAETVAKRLS